MKKDYYLNSLILTCLALLIVIGMSPGGFSQPHSVLDENIEGIWLGTLGELRVVYRITKNEDGVLKGFMDSPDQGAWDIPVDVTFENSTVRLEIKVIGVYEGKLKDSSTIEGTWKGARSMPLLLKRNKVPNQPSFTKLIPPEKLKEDLDFLFKIIEEVHPNMYAYTPKEEFTPIRDELYSQINRPMNRLELYKLVAPVVTSLKNGHMQVYLPKVGFRKYLNKGGKIIPLEFRWDGQDLILDKNYSPQKLPVGGRVLKINEQDTNKLITRFARYFPDEVKDNNPGWAARDLIECLWLEYGIIESWNLQIKDNDGKMDEYIVKPTSWEQFLAKKTVTPRENYSYRHLSEHNAGLLEVNTFGGNLQEFKKLLERTFKEICDQKISNLIIDICKNGGGNSNLGDALLDYLTDKPFRQFEKCQEKVSVQVDNLQWIRQNNPDTKVQIGSVVTLDVPFRQPEDNPLRFNGRKFVLIGPVTFSSANSFASAIKCFNIATLIGEETGGTTTAYGDVLPPFDLPNSGLRFCVPYKYFVEACGKPDGRGVLPDYEVKQTPEDTIKGIDTVLQFTLNLIRDPNSGIKQKPDNQSTPR